MPLIFTWQYAVSVVLALAALAGLRRGLWPFAAVVIVIGLGLLGIHSPGFLVSGGGWIMFLVTVLVANQVARIVLIGGGR